MALDSITQDNIYRTIQEYKNDLSERSRIKMMKYRDGRNDGDLDHYVIYRAYRNLNIGDISNIDFEEENLGIPDIFQHQTQEVSKQNEVSYPPMPFYLIDHLVL